MSTLQTTVSQKPMTNSCQTPKKGPSTFETQELSDYNTCPRCWRAEVLSFLHPERVWICIYLTSKHRVLTTAPPVKYYLPHIQAVHGVTKAETGRKNVLQNICNIFLAGFHHVLYWMCGRVALLMQPDADYMVGLGWQLPHVGRLIAKWCSSAWGCTLLFSVWVQGSLSLGLGCQVLTSCEAHHDPAWCCDEMLLRYPPCPGSSLFPPPSLSLICLSLWLLSNSLCLPDWSR